MKNTPSNKTTDYIPVDCSFYSKLELLALRRRPVTIRRQQGETISKQHFTIKTLRTREKEEFLITDENEEIRLDQILSIKPSE